MRNFLISIIILFVLLGSIPSRSTQAQSYRGLVIDEIKYDFSNAKKGSSIKESFTVTHDFQDRDKKTTLYVKALDFTSDGVTGTPKFVPPGTYNKQSSLSSWINFEQTTYTLTKYGQKAIINFTINIPENAEPGGKYAAILVSEKPIPDTNDPNATELGLTKQIGPLVLMTVEGAQERVLATDDFFTQNIFGNTYPIYFSMPVTLTARLKNEGNVHIVPHGQILIYRGDNFQDSIALYDMNPQNGAILPSSTREFSASWDDSFLTTELRTDKNTGKQESRHRFNWDKLTKIRIGRYKAKLLYTYQDETGNAVNQESDLSFIVIPWQLIVLIIILILIILIYTQGLAVLHIISGYKEKKRRSSRT